MTVRPGTYCSTLRLPPDLGHAIKTRAQHEDSSVNLLVIRALRHYLETLPAAQSASESSDSLARAEMS